MSEALLKQNVSLIVGLGNPGKRYIRTRHNVGYMVIEAIASKRKVQFRQANGDYELAEVSMKGRRIRLIKPLTFMNDSGKAISQVVRRYGYNPEDILTITDDVNLSVGKIRVRRNGADGGHNGLKSIIDHLGNSNFPRVRIGIGAAPESVALEDYVLGKPLVSEIGILAQAIDQAVELVFKAIRQGTEAVIGTYNITEENEVES